LDLLAQQRRGEVAGGVPRLRIASPDDIAPFVETNQQTLRRMLTLTERPPALLGARPGDVSGALAMAGLAADADLGPGAGEAIIRRVVILARAGRVALRTHEIPVLVQLGPMQDVIVLDLLGRIEMEPALSALLLRAGVPGDRERLQPSVREFDEILLQWIDPQGVFHLERGELGVRPVGLDEEFPALAEEAGMYAVIIKARAGEIAQHRCLGRVLHGEFVLRAVPELRLRRMALRAGVAADECERRSGATEKTRPRRVTLGEQLPGSAASEDRDRRCSDNDYDPSTRTHYCISARRAPNDPRAASAFQRQAGIHRSMTASTTAREGYGFPSRRLEGLVVPEARVTVLHLTPSISLLRASGWQPSIAWWSDRTPQLGS